MDKEGQSLGGMIAHWAKWLQADQLTKKNKISFEQAQAVIMRAIMLFLGQHSEDFKNLALQEIEQRQRRAALKDGWS